MEAVDAGVDELEDLRRKMRIGYGPCQGGFCVWRTAAMIVERGRGNQDDQLEGLERFLEERWRGQHTTIWGDQARQLLLNQAIYRGIFDLGVDGRTDEAGQYELDAGVAVPAAATAAGAGSSAGSAPSAGRS
jgi:glycerol-3-phosphate dehydrogenase